MAAQFTEITLEEMEKFLKRGFRALHPERGNKLGEVYYDLKLGKFVGIRVWTSIRPHSGMGAEVGADAIRVQFVSLKDQGPLEKGKAPIVKRTQNWRDSLQDRIEELVEKYEDNDEFWEQWAATRQRGGDPKREMKEFEEEKKEQAKEEVGQEQKVTPWRREPRRRIIDDEGYGNEDVPRHPSQPSYQREVSLEKLRGDITSKQAGFIRSLLRNVDHNEWGRLGLSAITGFDYIPKQEELLTLSKRQASQIIDALMRAGHGERRYASEELEELGVT